MHQRKRLSIKSVTAAGIAASALLGFAGVTLSSAPAEAVVYCTYVGYPGADHFGAICHSLNCPVLVSNMLTRLNGRPL